MSNIEVLKNLDDKGMLKPLVLSGLVSPKILTYIEIYYHVDSQVKRKVKKKQAVCNTAAVFDVTPQTVYNAIRALK